MKSRTLFFGSILAAAAMNVVPAWATDTTYDTNTTIASNTTIDGKISVNNGATVTQTAGTVSAARLVLNDSDAQKASFYTLKGGVLNISGTGKQSSAATDSNAILVGNRNSSDNAASALTVSGGVLNATSGDTTVSWNSDGKLEISGGEANLYGVVLNNFYSAAANITLSGSGRLNLGAGGLTYGNGTGAITNKTVTLAGGTLGALDSWSSSAAMSVTGNVTINTTKMSARTTGTATATSEGATIALSGNLSGTGGLIKTGAGTLNISGTNVQLGSLTVSAGTLNFTGTGTTINVDSLKLGVGSVNISGTGTRTFGTIEMTKGSEANSALTIDSGTTVSATIFKNEWGLKTLTVNGVLNVSDTFQYTTGSKGDGDTINGTGTISAKTFNIGNNGYYNVSGVTLEVGSGGVIHSADFEYKLNLGNATVKATDDFAFAADGNKGETNLTDATTGTTFDTNGHAITVAAIFKGTGNLIKTGAGTLKLSGANTFTGDVKIEKGTIEVTNASALGSSGTTTVESGSVLKVSVADGVNAGTGAVKFASGAKFAIDLTAYSEVIEADKALSVITASAISFNNGNTNTVTLTSAEIEKYFSAADSNLGSWTNYVRTWGYDSTAGALTLTLTIPEPSTFGLLAGVGALALVAARRRRRAK